MPCASLPILASGVASAPREDPALGALTRPRSLNPNSAHQTIVPPDGDARREATRSRHWPASTPAGPPNRTTARDARAGPSYIVPSEPDDTSVDPCDRQSLHRGRRRQGAGRGRSHREGGAGRDGRTTRNTPTR